VQGAQNAIANKPKRQRNNTTNGVVYSRNTAKPKREKPAPLPTHQKPQTKHHLQKNGTDAELYKTTASRQQEAINCNSKRIPLHQDQHTTTYTHQKSTKLALPEERNATGPKITVAAANRSCTLLPTDATTVSIVATQKPAAEPNKKHPSRRAHTNQQAWNRSNDNN